MSIPNQTRVAIVTGAAQGIGRAIALHLAADGINIAVNDIASKSSLLDDLVKEIEQVGGRRKALAVPCDVSKEDEVSAMVQKVVEQLGRLDIVSCSSYILTCLHLCTLKMIANAGIGSRGSVLTGKCIIISTAFWHDNTDLADPETWTNVWNINFVGALLCYKHAAIQMVKQGSGGRIVG